MAYGTGPIPFIRTSDLSNWELKADPKHGVSEELFLAAQGQVGRPGGDILMVRDGTYLIGTCAIVTELDTRILFQSHIYKIRVLDTDHVDPWLLFACLNAPIVKRQIRSKQFTQDIIDTLGNRLLELVVPIPRDAARRRTTAEETRHVVESRAELRRRAVEIALGVEGTDLLASDDREIVEEAL